MSHAQVRLLTGRSVLASILVALAVCSTLLVVQAAAPKVDNASAAEFCVRQVVFSGNRCVDYRRVNQTYIQANIDDPTPTGGQYCVGAKQYADGTGGNTEPFGCAYPQQTLYTYTGNYSSALGYATIINNTGRTQFVIGTLYW